MTFYLPRTEDPTRRVWLRISIPKRPDEPLWLVVIRGFSESPIFLLTNIAPTSKREYAIWISDIYLTRWKCEKTYRFLKQSYNLEDVRVRAYVSLRNIYVLVHAISYFVSVVIGIRARLSLIFKRLYDRAKRFYQVSAFFHYALADGIHRALFSTTGSLIVSNILKTSNQLLLSLANRPRKNF